MAVITSNDVIVGLKKGVTWGTEIVLTSGVYLYASSVSVTGGDGDFLPRDSGLSGKRSTLHRLSRNVNVKLTCDATFGQGWMAPFCSVMGTESVPAETTGSQADYSSNIDVADSTSGIFWTLAWNVETDRVLAIPSVKWTSATISFVNGNAGTVTFDGIGDTVLESSTSSYSTISGLAKYTYESAILGATNHYARFNAASGSALSSTDNKTILNFDFTISRPHQTRFALRGASSLYTLEPLQLGPIDAKLKVKFSEIDNATFDIWGIWAAATAQKGEILIDGSQIGTGVNRSMKLQLPALKPLGAIPSGHDLPNNNSLLEPEITFECLKAASAPSGMSGVTDLARMVSIVATRSAKWTA